MGENILGSGFSPINIPDLAFGSSSPPTPVYTPDPSTFAPNANNYLPDSSTFAPDPSTFAPDPSVFSPDPSAIGSDPSSFGPDPSTFGPDGSAFGPDSSPIAPDPSMFGPDPSTFGPDPSTFGPDPSTNSPDPSAPGADPSMSDSDASTYGSDLSPFGPGPSTLDPDPSIPVSEPKSTDALLTSEASPDAQDSDTTVIYETRLVQTTPPKDAAETAVQERLKKGHGTSEEARSYFQTHGHPEYSTLPTYVNGVWLFPASSPTPADGGQSTIPPQASPVGQNSSQPPSSQGDAENRFRDLPIVQGLAGFATGGRA